MADAPLYKQLRRYTRDQHDVELHDNHKLHVVCTSKGRDVDKMLSMLRRKIGGMASKLVGIDVEYMHYVQPHWAAVLQLCVEQECLFYQIAAAKDRPIELDKFLMNDEYIFAGFAIEGDKKKLQLSRLEINSDNYIDIQVEWGDPYKRKKFDSLAEVACRLIDIHYYDMKNKINRDKDHTKWGFCLLPDKLIKYAAIDAFATYESWRIIYDVIMGLDRAKREKRREEEEQGYNPIQQLEMNRARFGFISV